MCERVGFKEAGDGVVGGMIEGRIGDRSLVGGDDRRGGREGKRLR